MFRIFVVSSIVLALASVTVSESRAQDRLDLSGLELNVHGGVAILDAPEQSEFYAGGTALVHLGGGLALGGTVDWVSSTVEELDDDFDATLWYYNGEVQYGIPSATNAQFYVLGGVGVARFSPGEELQDLEVDSDSEIMVPLGLGVRWVNDKTDASWGATLEFRDRIVVFDEEEQDNDTKVSNDWTIGLGLSLILGG